MKKTNKEYYRDPWDFNAPPTGRSNGLYITVSGNSGAGKSHLVEAIAEAIYHRDGFTIAIDETSLHHPFLPHLFHATDEFGLEHQLNFMLQRVLLIKHWLKMGYNLIMERSHLEDLVFIRHLQQQGHASKIEEETYTSLWNVLDKRTPKPDVLLFLEAPPEKSIQRITQDEATGKRIEEFPDERKKEAWIRSWHALYKERLLELKNGSILGKTKLIVASHTAARDTQNLVQEVFKFLGDDI